VSPSDLGGAKALPGASEAADEAAAKRRGSVLHWLLEHLPGWPRADHAALAAQNPEVTAADLAEVQACLDAPDLAALFTDPGLLREVPVSGTLPHGLGPAFGVLDLVEVTPERVRIIDFKSNATVPATAAEVPEGLLRQMGAYRALAAQAFPRRPVEVALLWTRTATLMPLPGALTDAALARATRP
jgi:ATP-dependent helicase/nuclease subunit A